MNQKLRDIIESCKAYGESDSATEDAIGKIQELYSPVVESAKYYADADYKGEWNNVDGGKSAREALKAIGEME